MAFTATYNLKIDSSGDSVPIAGAYFRIDGSSISGGKDSGYSALFRVYKNQAVRVADVGDDISPDSRFYVSIPYVDGQDPYPALYDLAKSQYTDAVDVI